MLAAFFFIIFILIHLDSCAKRVTRFIIKSDFLLITGGESETFAGGFITIVYFCGIIFIAIALLQEQLILNDWIDSTQMASQSSELLVSNTLFMRMKFHVTQIPLNTTEEI